MYGTMKNAKNNLPPAFIVGTGRCGSTFLSEILRRTRDCLSLSEFFVSLGPRAFAYEKIIGRDLWEIFSTPRSKFNLMYEHGLIVPELLFHGERGYDIPPIMAISLPHLSNDPETLFAELFQYINSMSLSTLSNQYRRLFRWLCHKCNKSIWVERSGGSLRYIDKLVRLFPEAKFVHIVRDGRECAISMSRHHAFRLTAIQQMIEEIIGMDPFSQRIPPYQRECLKELRRLLPDEFDKRYYEAFQIPIEKFGLLWSAKIVKGLGVLRTLESHQIMTMHYEHLLIEPEIEIWRMLEFIHPKLAEDGFVHQVSRLVRRDKTLAMQDLDQKNKEKLDRACAMGKRALDAFLRRFP
jgi:hypothetical protein